MIGENINIGIAVLVVLLLTVFIGAGGCKSYTKNTTKISYYRTGEIQSTFYEQEKDESFKFFSEGSGKTIEISPSVNGVGL